MKQRTLITLVALTLFVAVIQEPQWNEAKKIKIKIKLKDLKKLKKYAYLLAGQRKKFYAIPFPFPLPVFVKRQHIYTQIPIIHRQVPMPQPYGSPAMSADTYESMSSSYSTPEPKYPGGEDYYSSSSASYGMPRRPSGASSSQRQPSSGTSTIGGSYLGSLSSGLASPSSKYLAQIMSLALNQAYPGSSGASSSGFTGSSGIGITTGREVIGKLLSGQAKVLSPSSLLTSLKSSSVATNQQQDTSNGYNKDQKTSTASASSSSSSTGGSGGADDDGAPSTSSTSGTKTSSSSDGLGESTKPSASEMHRSRTRAHQSHLRHLQNPFTAAAYPADPFRLASMMQYPPFAHPLATLAGAASPLMPRLPLQMSLPLSIQAQQLAAGGGAAAGDFLASLGDQQQQMMEQSANNQLDNQQDTQETAASSQQDYEMSPAATGGLSLAAPRRQPMSGQQYLLAMQRLQRQRHQEELRLALARERDEALRLAESRAILMRAHQLALPDHENPARFVRYYRPQVMR